MKTYSLLAFLPATTLSKSLPEQLLSKLNPNSKYFDSATKYLNNEISNKRVKRQSLDAMYDMFDDAMMDLGIQEMEANDGEGQRSDIGNFDLWFGKLMLMYDCWRDFEIKLEITKVFKSFPKHFWG